MPGIKKKHVVAIFCDLKKAFDTVDHKILLRKLERYGIHNISLDWFSNYLSERKQLISISNVQSCLRLITASSILGPLLFLTYINGLPLCTDFLTLLFADDTTLLYSHSNPEILMRTVNEELWKVNNYFRFHKMSLHTQKKLILYLHTE